MKFDIEQAIKHLKEVQESIDFLEKEKEEERQRVLAYLNENEIGQYKNELATISFIERKTIKTKRDEQDICNELISRNLEHLVEVVPEHFELNKDYERLIKQGSLEVKGVEIETKESPLIRFN